ncbi:MAG: SpaA isopeptide-forming pilin-related protein [Candidatus Pristimantibacillus lignocellulolyticus]|uniref:SpaA isopeptide-forming pilin-related protein n=1 Tax=Candidatus Pristimantibacillus lignocellulolyticus TaxID=2994561 RepID=A0A9J6ZHV8_9BACL|nr:MAG: SpaA isopeptide-forming pilin-related protein [Candidatus Pristimantibacillus lignocellulolyticus]
MRKYAKIIWICLLVIALQASSISKVLVSYAAGSGNDVTGQVASQFITGVDIRQKVGTMPGNTLIGTPDLEKDTDFMLLYEFTVPNVHSIVEDDFIILDVPAAIKFPIVPAAGQEIYATTLINEDDGTVVATAYLIAGNKIKLVFSDSVQTLSNVGGAFFLAGNFDETQINADGTATDISFGIPNQKVTLTFKKDPIPEPDPVTVQKDGAITNGTDIAWKITVNKENVAVNNAVIVDAIPASQSLDDLSIKINGAVPATGAVTVTGNNLSIALGDITTQQEITFVTSLREASLLAALEAGDTSIAVTNNATLQHDDNETTNADSPKTVTIPLNILSKSGSYNATTTANNTKNITWTIVVNEDELAFNNAIIKDTLPAGLTYIAGTATVNGGSVTPVTSGSELTFNLGNITNEVTITYETEIAPARFLENGSYNFTNAAVLTWDGLTGTGVVKNASVGVGSNLFTKSGAGYNRANGVISWSININSENINLVAPMITDVIPTTQQYIQGSARIVDHQGNAYTGGDFNFIPGTRTLTYEFNSDINSRYTITFDTKPATTENITANFISNNTTRFSNTATFTSGVINRSSTGTQGFTSNVLKKDSEGYDLDVAERTITWRLTVNENGATTPSTAKAGTNPSLYDAISLSNISIVDDIPDGLTFVPSSVRVVNLSGNPVTGLVTVSGTDVVTFAFNSPITEQYTIYFDTTITDLSQFISQNNTLNNGNFDVTNEATLTHNETSRSNTDPATQTISNHIVSKKGIPTANGNKYIDWVVYLNSNAVNLNQLLDVDRFWLIDNLQAGLELDTTSVELIAYSGAINVPNNIPTSGIDGLGAGTPITLNGSHIVYDATTREFRFNFPNDTIDKAYKLSFRTYVTESVTSGSSFSNSINLFGSKDNVAVPIDGAYQSNDSRQVTFLQAGSLGYGNLGKFIVNKVDLDDNNVKLSGATFALYDQYGNKVQEKVTVDGELEFNRIKFDLPYYIKEVQAPTGYLLSGDVSVNGTPVTATTTGAVVEDAIPITLTASHTPKYLELVFANEEIKATVQFIKKNEAGNPLAGAEFGLFPRGAAASSTPLATATSNSLGVVSFENVNYGEYDIREILAPAGYRTLTGVVHAVEVTEADHGTTIALADVSNSLIRANIEFVKLDDSGDELEGAEFKLYNSGNVAVATSESDEDGLVEFKNVLAGSYTIRETKTPFGYMPLTGDVFTTTITEANHGSTIDLGNVTNVLIQASIEFVKNNENSQPLAGATFGLYNTQNVEINRVTSGTDGKVTFTNVGEGTYTIKEISPPYGYKLIEGIIDTVTISNADHNKTKQLAPVANTLIKASIEFLKVSEKNQPLAGAVFELLDVNNNNQLVQTKTSGTDGKVTFVDVGEGKYVIREKTAPVGYNPLTSDVGTVDINGIKHNTTVTLPNVTNEIITGDVKFEKVDKSTGKPLKNATFALYASDDTKFDNEIATAVSDDNGIVLFEDVEYGDYTIIEVAPPGGYYHSDEELSVSIRIEGHTYNLGNFENQLRPVELIEGTIEVKKVNELSDPLTGAKFGLYNVMGTLVAEGVTNSSGIVRFTEVIGGVYTVKELEAPKNYVKSDQIENVTISSENYYVKLTFVNERSSDAPWPNVSVQKVDEAGAPLAGVKFALYKATDTAFTSAIANSTTNASGIATFTNILPGKYVVKEVEALEGYILSTVILPVTVTDDAKTHDAGTVENRLIRNDIVVNKVNENDEPLNGAKFGLYDKDGKLVEVAVSDSEGIADFKNIPYGSYSLKELVAPDLYEKSDGVIAINITIDGVTQAFTFVNKKVNVSGVKPEKPDTDSNGPGGTPGTGSTETDIDSNKPGVNGGNNTGGANQSNQLPKTGDSISTMIWLFVGSGLAIVALLLVGRRRTYKQ